MSRRREIRKDRNVSFIFDPRFFNVAIIAMFIAAAIRWAWEKNWAQAGYWASAALLNVFVTIGVK